MAFEFFSLRGISRLGLAGSVGLLGDVEPVVLSGAVE